MTSPSTLYVTGPGRGDVASAETAARSAAGGRSRRGRGDGERGLGAPDDQQRLHRREQLGRSSDVPAQGEAVGHLHLDERRAALGHVHGHARVGAAPRPVDEGELAAEGLARVGPRRGRQIMALDARRTARRLGHRRGARDRQRAPELKRRCGREVMADLHGLRATCTGAGRSFMATLRIAPGRWRVR
jgi:hypothetical protein